MSAPNPIDRKTIAGTINKTFFRPALTSHFEVRIKQPPGSETFFARNIFGVGSKASIPDNDLTLWCSDATLPGSSLMTHESNNDFTGVTERFAYRRLYDDRIDLSYYVDAVNHTTIRFFETWIKYVADEQIAGNLGVKNPNYFYRFRYPDGIGIDDKGNGGYRGNTLSVTKFERDYAQSGRGKKLVYEFIKPYPISFQSIPVSYDGSQLLKCTVSMTYTRYFIDVDNSVVGTTIEPTEPGQTTSNQTPKSPFDITTQDLARLNSQAFNPNVNLGNLSAGTLTNTNFNSNNLF